MISQHLELSGRYNILVPAYSASGKLATKLASDTGGTIYGVELGQLWPQPPNILSPCEFLTTKISPKSFSLAHLTPPLNWKRYELPSEHEYLRKTTQALKVGGVLVALISQTVINNPASLFMQHLHENYHSCEFCLSKDYQYYIIVLGVRRASTGAGNFPKPLLRPIEKASVLRVGTDEPPRAFEKGGFTKLELMEAVGSSPLRGVFSIKKEVRKPRPPLELGSGHIASMIASGQFDGLINVPGFEPHVVKGSTRKADYVKDQREEESKDGSVSDVVVMSERVIPVIRAAWQDSRIETYE